MLIVNLFLELLKISFFLAGFFALIIIGIHVAGIVFNLACDIVILFIVAVEKIFTRRDK